VLGGVAKKAGYLMVPNSREVHSIRLLYACEKNIPTDSSYCRTKPTWWLYVLSLVL